MWFVALLLIAAAGFVWWQIEHDKHAAAQKSAQQRYDIKHVYAQRGLAIRQSDIDAIMDAPDIENAHQKLLETAIKYTLSLEKSGRSTAGISEYQTAEFRRLCGGARWDSNR